MKNNTFKRVLAGSLALLTVAAPMTANVEGILQEVAIVASAKTGDNLTLTWDTTSEFTSVQKYLTAISVGTTTYSSADIKNAVGGFNISGAQGSTAKIVSTVPLTGSFGVNCNNNAANYKTLSAYYDEVATKADYVSATATFEQVKNSADNYKKLINAWRAYIRTDKGYYNVTDLVKSDDSYELQKGDFTVTEKNNTWTYELVVPENEANSNAIALRLDGDTQDVSFLYAKDDKATGNFTATVDDSTGADTEVTQANIESNAVATVNKHIINGTYKFTSTSNFTVETNDGKASNNTADFDAVFNSSNNTYEAEVTIPKYAGNGAGTTIVTIKHLPEASLTYTASGNKLLVNGSTVNQDTVAASIEASAKRAEVKDENEKVTEEKIDIKDFTATNGHITYGKDANDGVTVKIDRNTNLTTYYGDQAVNPSVTSYYAELTIKKDNAIYNGYDKVKFRYGEYSGVGTDNGYTYLSGGDKDYYEHLTGYAADYNPADDTNAGVDNDYKTWRNSLIPIFNNAAKDNAGVFFHEAGEYTVTAVFYTKRDDGGTDVQTVNYTFNIDAIKLTGDDATIMMQNDGGTIKLTDKATAFTDGETMELEVPYDVAGEETFNADVDLLSKLWDGDGNVPATVANGVIAVHPDFDAVDATGNIIADPNANGAPAVADYKLKDGHTLDGFVKWTGTEVPTNLAAGAYRYAIEGQTTATALNTKNTVTIKIYDQNYGATLVTKGTQTYVKPYEIKVSYMLVEAAQEPKIAPVDDPEDIDGDVLVVAQEDTSPEKFKEIFWANYEGNEFVKSHMDDITFEYLPAKGKTVAAEDLDTRYAGFPTKKNDDGYSLFICYNGEAFDSKNVEIVSVKAKFVPDSDALSMTYGDQIDLDSYTLQDADGNTLSKLKLGDVAIKYIAKAADKDVSTNAGKKNGVQPYIGPDGDYVKGDYVYTKNVAGQDNSAVDPEDLTLNAGTYIVKYAPKRESGSDYTVSSDEFVLNVAKRQITADMFYISAKTYDGKTQSINLDTDCTFRYETETGAKIEGTLQTLMGADAATLGNIDGATLDNEKQFVSYTKTDGQTDAVEAGRYNVSIKLNDQSKTNWTTDFNNFVGSAKLTWSVTPSVNAVDPNFVWSADDTTLFDAGRIHVQFSKKANNKLGLNSKVTVSQYGVIVDNKGLIAAPDDAQLDGNTYNGTTVPVAYSDVYEYAKTGVADNTVYGAVNGTNLYDDACAKLVFGNGLIEGKASAENQAKNIYGANIKVKDVETGIWARPYMLFSDGTVRYGEPIYVDITREAMKNLQVAFNPDKKLDKTKTNAGYDAENNKYIAYAKYEKLDATKVQAVVRDFGVVVDNKGYFGTDGVAVDSKKKNVVDDMKLGVDNLIVGHNNKAANAVLAQEEYGAKIKPSNSVTGVWVRAYVKLSDTLVVYSKPEYYETVSQYYAGGPAVGADTGNPDGIQLPDLNATAITGRNDVAHNTRVHDTAMTYNTEISEATLQATPVLFKPVKAYDANAAGADVNGYGITFDNTNRMYTIKFQNTVKSSNKNYEFVKMGVVVDKNEKLVKRETIGTETRFKLVDDADQQLVLGNGFVEGEKTDGKATYTARVEPNGNRIIAVRPYVTFKVDGNEVTVYGDIVMNNCGTCPAEFRDAEIQ